jgi:hypothetical protein
MKKIIIFLFTATIFYIPINISAQESKFFHYTIKGNNCEYNVRKASEYSIIISNINNTWGSNTSPTVQDYGASFNTKEDYITIYKILKSTIDMSVFNKLLSEEKIPSRNVNIFNYDDITKSKLKNSNQLGVFIRFYPINGKIFEIYFSIKGKILQNISPDYYYEIERKIKESGITENQTIKTGWKFYVQHRYEYRFNDLDSEEFNGERVILSNIR